MPLYVTCASRRTIALPELLASRDARQTRQQQWQTTYATPLISFTTVAPGPIKDSELSRCIFNHGIRALRQILAASGWQIVHQRCFGLATGAEGLVAVDAPAWHSSRPASHWSSITRWAGCGISTSSRRGENC
jgi:Phosphoribosyl-dephospho-CoA transferase (holo-ACP synthetase)